MKCICNNNKNIIKQEVFVIPYDIEKPINEENFVTFGYTASVGGVERYNITVDREYDVYGIVMYKGEIYFLVQNDDALLRLYNFRLFKITYNELFCEWGMKQYYIGEDIFTIISFGYFIEYNNFIKLLEDNKESIKVFLDYKNSMW